MELLDAFNALTMMVYSTAIRILRARPDYSRRWIFFKNLNIFRLFFLGRQLLVNAIWPKSPKLQVLIFIFCRLRFSWPTHRKILISNIDFVLIGKFHSRIFNPQIIEKTRCDYVRKFCVGVIGTTLGTRVHCRDRQCRTTELI